MQRFNSGALAILLAAVSMTVLTGSSLAQSCTCIGSGIRADLPPPPLPVYDQPPLPAPGYIWTPGYWYWNNLDFYWVPGTWVEPPRPGVLWTPGYWGFSNGVYVFNLGYWGPHIGFYGGISYGFGYTGSGYQGGRWDNGAFYYNRSVNNVSNTNVTNIYNETVTPANVSNTRASFNGGAGGTAAKPTVAEEAAERDPHEKPTAIQIDHTRAASLNAGSFASTNHGTPAVAATPKPGTLTGPNVIKAKNEVPAAAQPTEPPPAVAKPGQSEAKPLHPHPAEPAAAAPKPAPNLSKPESVQPVEPAPAPAVAKPVQIESKPQPPHPAEPAPPTAKPAQIESKPQPPHPAEPAPPAAKPAQMESRPQPPHPEPEKPKPSQPKCGGSGEPPCR